MGFRRNSKEIEREDFFVYNKSGLDVDYSAIKPDLKLEHCNSILKKA